MIEALRIPARMWLIAWRAGPVKMSVALLLTILSGLAWPTFAWSLSVGTDAVIDGNTSATWFAGLAMSVTVIGALMFNHFAYVPYAEATESATVTLEAELMELANRSARLEHFERADFADRFSLAQEEVSSFSFGMIGLMATVSLSMSMTVTGLLLASVSRWLLLLPLAAIPPLFTAHWAVQILDRAKEAAARPKRQAMHLLRLSISAESAMELRVTRLQREIRRRHRENWDEAGAVQWRAERRATVVAALGQLVFALAYVGAILLVVRSAVGGRSRMGDVFLVVVLAAQVNLLVNAGLEQFRRLRRMSAGLARLEWLRNTVREHRQQEDEAPVPDRLRTGIELRGLTFQYPGIAEPVLRDVSLTLPAGSLIAIVGENGAGKTTLVKLLSRLYEPTDGDILVDGTDLRRLPAEEWRRHIAAGFQDFARFELVARETVGVGDVPMMDDEAIVLGALRRAHGSDVISELEEGLNTPLGKTYRDGVELSGGQWQKLALGRAMMRAAPLLLLLDEPTSALDAQVEHHLFTRYAEAARRTAERTGAITVLVSHRFSTVRMADMIVVVDRGRIVEAGDHGALMEHGGLYAELYALQAGAFQQPGTSYPGARSM